MTKDLSPLSNGAQGAANLNTKLAGINHDLHVVTGKMTFEEITSSYKNKKCLSFREWLQREEQKKKWTKDDSRTAKSYVQGVFQTYGVTEEFLFCDIDFLLRDINSQKEIQPKLEGLWNKLITWLERSKKLGTKFVILDGQNRIKYALAPFRYDGLSITLRYNGEEHNNVKYEELDDNVKEQINNHVFRVSVVVGGDVTKVVDKLININDGEPWSEHERRDVRWTSVSFSISEIASEPLVKKLHIKTLKHIWTSTYALDKKGITLFIAEMLYFLRNGDKGTPKSLTDMYHAEDENIERQLKSLNELFKFVSKNFPVTEASENFTKETYRNLLIYLSMLTNTRDVPRSRDLTHNFKLSQIQNPQLLLERIIKRIKSKLADKNQITPFEKGGGELTLEQVKSLPKEKVVWSRRNAKAGSYLNHHSASQRVDLEARQNLFISDLNDIIDICIKDSTLLTHDGRRVTKQDRLMAEVKYQNAVIEGLRSDDLGVIGYELDHVKSVAKGGGSDGDNLDYIPRDDNRKKGPH